MCKFCWSCVSEFEGSLLLTSALVQGDLLLLDVIRREARRYVKSSALFQDPTPLDLEMINSAAVNLHDLEVGVHFPPG